MGFLIVKGTTFDLVLAESHTDLACAQEVLHLVFGGMSNAYFS
jgi:hypothetical protein